MGSSRAQDRSLNEATFLPQWMKGRVDNRFHLDESSFSPPSHDDNFFCIRYARKQDASEKQAFQTIDDVLQDKKSTVAAQQVTPSSNVPELKNRKEIDFSKHPAACQPFVPTASNKPELLTSPKIPIPGQAKPKSHRTTDCFNDELARCGKSIVHVAHQMMSHTLAKAGSTSEDPSEQKEALPKKGSSKSLPATPLTSPISTPDSSPKSRRRHNSNRYFTGAFLPDREKYHPGWILSSLLCQSREVVTTKIEEEKEEEPVEVATPPRTIMHRKKSISSQNLTYIGNEEKPEKALLYTNVLQPKPSEFREMNFWSPTSM